MTTKLTYEELEEEVKELESTISDLEEEAKRTKEAIHSITLDYIAVEETERALNKILDNAEIKLSMAETLSIKRVLKYLEILGKKMYEVY